MPYLNNSVIEVINFNLDFNVKIKTLKSAIIPLKNYRPNFV